MSEPRTEAGRDMLEKHGYRRPVSAEWIRDIEGQAIALQARALLAEFLKAHVEVCACPFDGTDPDCNLTINGARLVRAFEAETARLA